MIDMISENIFILAASNITMLAWIVAALLLLGAGLRALKKLALARFSRALGSPDDRVPRLAGKPGAGLLAVLALTGAAGYAESPVLPHHHGRAARRRPPSSTTSGAAAKPD